MSYKALYRKYRPTTFEDVVGQDYIVKTLKQTLKKNKLGHAYLFTGTRGTGKTSVAKIFAKSVNCLNQEEAPCNKCEICIASDKGLNPDIIELDAASNTGVDDVRNIIEQLKYVPFQSKYKVYIIDEVHMLSPNAFNALLKTLEEPPEHVIFILATTEPHKVLPTIISRCQRFDFLRVDKDSIIKRLSYIEGKENISVSDTAKKMIASLADGGMRDALSILDQCIAYSGDNKEINENTIKEIYGLTSTADKVELIKKIHNKEAKDVLNQLKEFLVRGIDFKRLTNDFINIFKESILYSYTKEIDVLDSLNIENVEDILKRYEEEDLLKMIDILMTTSESYATATNIFSYFEVACLKLMNIGNNNLINVKEAESKKEEKQNITEEIEKEDEAEKQDSSEMLIENDVEVSQELTLQEGTNEINEEVFEENELSINTKKKNKSKALDTILDNETLLQLVVQCTRDQRTEDENKFKFINDYRYDFNLAKYVNLLNKTQIAASGDDCILVMSAIEPIVNNINEKQMNKELYQFLEGTLGIDKMIYALTEEQYKEVLDMYRERVAIGTLPSKYKVVRYDIKKEVVKEKEPIERVIDLFGLENVEIIEEEN